jgi:hypothetical protein
MRFQEQVLIVAKIHNNNRTRILKIMTNLAIPDPDLGVKKETLDSGSGPDFFFCAGL